jgi:hypothetical protein
MRQRVLLAGALALVSQAALSDETNAARTEAEELTVSAPSQEIAIADPRIETDAEAVIEAMNRQVAADLARIIEAISGARIELAISESPTRG